MNRDRFPGLSDGWARLDGPAGTQMVDSAIEAMDDWMRSGHNANHGGLFEAARHTDELVASTRESVAALLGGDAARRRLRPEHDRHDDALLGRRRTCAAARRRDRLHAPGPRRQRAPVADRGRARRGDGALRPARARDARAARVRRRGRAHRRARAGSRSPPRRTRSARCPTCRGSSLPRTPPARACMSTRSTRRRTGGSTSRRSAATRSRARPTSGSARTSGSCGAGPSCWPSCSRTSCARRRTRVPDRWELGTLPFEQLAGVRAAADYVLSADWDAVRAHEESLLAAALDGLGAMSHVTLYGAARDRAPTLMFSVAGRAARRGGDRPRRPPGGGVARQLLRLGARAPARPRPARRRSAPASCTTTPKPTRSGCWPRWRTWPERQRTSTAA